MNKVSIAGVILGAFLGAVIGRYRSVALMFFDYDHWGMYRIGGMLVGVAAGGLVGGILGAVIRAKIDGAE